jgi:hypothetical protein
MDNAESEPVVAVRNLWAVLMQGTTEPIHVSDIPFLATPVGEPTAQEAIPIGAVCERLFFLGMINHGWDHGQAHWSSHHSVHPSPEHDLAIGDEIGRILVHYHDGSVDTIPLVLGFTAWWYRQWWVGREKFPIPVTEPFASHPELMSMLRESLYVHEDLDDAHRWDDPLRHFCLVYVPRRQPLDYLEVLDNPAKAGRPALSAITVQSVARIPQGVPLGEAEVPGAIVARPLTAEALDEPRWRPSVERLRRGLYTFATDLPDGPQPYSPTGYRGPRVEFGGGALGRMLSNIWNANLDDIDRKFSPETGEFRESRKDSPWYGGYTGIGTWAPLGIYHPGVYGRSAEHIATLPLRLIDDPGRRTNFVDYCDRWLYFFRPNSDPAKGPPNPARDGGWWDPTRYPEDAPPHWTFVLNAPGGGAHHGPLNDIPGTEEMAGHGSVIIARYVAWRHHGSPLDGWLTDPRADVYGKSRWESTVDACEFILWLMDHTGMDVIYSEGEETGWGGNVPGLGWSEPGNPKALLPPGMQAPRDADQRRWFYANCDAYEVYPAYMCLVALQCGAVMADARGETNPATRWRAYADRIRHGMLRKLAIGDYRHRQWRVSPYSVYPSFQDSLAPLFAAFYSEGLDTLEGDLQMFEVTRNTYYHQRAAPHGLAPVLGMGYGLGWMTKAALMLDEMDDVGELLGNLATFTYDKNMAESPEGQDWEPFLWLIPEGVRLGPDRDWWYRIGDLTNGANQGPPMHALEMVVGVDDVRPNQPRIMPRIPHQIGSISVQGFPMLVADGDGTRRVRIDYAYDRARHFEFRADSPVANLQIRLGPWRAAAPDVVPGGASMGTRWVVSGFEHAEPAHWMWLRFAEPVRRLVCHLEDRDGCLAAMTCSQEIT